MKNAKINIDKASLSSSEIQASKNFNEVSKAYQKNNGSNNNGNNGNGGAGSGFGSWMIGLTITGLTIFGSVMLLDKDDQPVEGAYIEAPIQGVDVKRDTFKVAHNTADTINYTTGSTLIVPANAFLDENGKEVQGEVDIVYREFRDAVDFFLSGIPMTYDSAGTTYHFESAGMMEIRAYHEGKEVFVNPGKEIKVQFASDFKDDRYNIYYLDEKGKKWDYHGKDVLPEEEEVAHEVPVRYSDPEEIDHPLLAEKAPEMNIDKDPVNKEIKRVEKKIEEIKKTEPKEANEKNFNLEIMVDAKEFPELALYKGSKFEVHPEKNPGFKPSLANEEWHACDVEQGEEEKEYVLTFKNFQSKKEASITTYPVFEGKDYETAKAEFDKKHQKYKDTLQVLEAERAAKIERRKQEIANFQKRQQEIWDSLNQVRVTREAAQFAAMNAENKVNRIFEVERFGVWNSDCPSKMPQGTRVLAKYSRKDGVDEEIHHVYLVDRNMNAKIYLYGGAPNNFTFNPESETQLWTMGLDQKLLVIHSEDMEKAAHQKGEVLLSFDTYELEGKSEADIREILSY